MKKRIITGIVAAMLFIPILWFSYTYVFSIVMSILCVIASFEMMRCVGLDKKLQISLPLYAVAAITPVIVHMLKGQDEKIFVFAFALTFFSLMYAYGNLLFSKTTPFADALVSYVTGLYIIGAFVSIVLVRDTTGGEYLFMLIFFGAWMTDIFAYFTGMLFGKHKLIPHISPKKTIEGSIGGIVFCTLSFVIYGIAITHFTNYTFNIPLLIIAGVVLSVVSQIGDLIMSLIKRHYNIKDYGKILPGHGGILDRFDSILAVSLVLYILLKLFETLFSQYIII